MKKIELVFIPMPIIGHLSSTFELINLILNKDHRLSVTLLLPNLTNFDFKTISSHILSPSATPRFRFITFPELPHDQEYINTFAFKSIVESQKQRITETVTNLYASDSSTLAGFVVDFLFVSMMDLANEFRVPTYVFFTTNAGYLSLLFHFQQLYDQSNYKDMDKLLDSADEFSMPAFVNSIPSKTISTLFANNYVSEWILDVSRRYREASGILVNTFSELEFDVMNLFSDTASTSTSKFPPIYSIGPILDLKRNSPSQEGVDILKWLDEQPVSSVVFLCFGSMGSFNEDQIKEIALALERTGVRFLWSLRLPTPLKANIEDVLPEGFLDRTIGIGRVIGWAPQAEILAHPATGGFVSHCGWNSTLESLWYGVPMAAWPLYCEQQFNAFEMVVELGLAVEISWDYVMDGYLNRKGFILSREKIESGIRKLMEDNEELKKLFKMKSEECRKTIKEGGSSFIALNCFIDAVIANSM